MMIKKICFLLSLYTSTTFAGLSHHNRPLELQEAIDHTVESLSAREHLTWGSAGSSEDLYAIGGLNEERIFCDRIKSEYDSKGRTQFTAVDLGGGYGGWSKFMARQIASWIESDPEAPRDIEVTFLSLTAESKGREPQETIIGVSKVRVLWGVALENLGQDLERHPHKEWLRTAVGNADLIVSKLTFLHLHDPFGTLAQVYDLLRP